MGARWMTPFSTQIIQSETGFILMDGKGRKHRLPNSILTEAYDVPYEGISINVLENSNLIVNFGSAWYFHFQSFDQGLSYQLVLEQNSKTDELVVLNYLIASGHAFLQSVDFKLKRTAQTVKFAYNPQMKLIAVFVDEEPEPLAHYDYDTQGNLITAVDQNAQTRSYEYNAGKNQHQNHVQV
ncbi:YD repeat-containing protein [Acinetobacter calcoaceticus]|uniref:YD repeat-containing protein n=1 Tax=Acinetobacter calcoaceticus TaxID=471 RepID=A0A4R1XDX7_ACICA|nr:YD repeat-containing protein [Acinetobacter calcoaceticus]